MNFFFICETCCITSGLISRKPPWHWIVLKKSETCAGVCVSNTNNILKTWGKDLGTAIFTLKCEQIRAQWPKWRLSPPAPSYDQSNLARLASQQHSVCQNKLKIYCFYPQLCSTNQTCTDLAFIFKACLIWKENIRPNFKGSRSFQVFKSFTLSVDNLNVECGFYNRLTLGPLSMKRRQWGLTWATEIANQV